MELNRIKAHQQLKEYTQRWELIPEEGFFYTVSSLLQAVKFKGRPAMLKIPFTEEERRGANVMAWWRGRGAAKVLIKDSNAMVLERLFSNQQTLVDMVRNGDDEQALGILCSVAQKIHAINEKPLPSLVPLASWFKDLEGAAKYHGGLFLESWGCTQELLRDPQESIVLHGDLHHGNVLHSVEDGWLVIDPKGLIGERYFDYANLFCNPDRETALQPGRFAARLEFVAKEADLHPKRLLKWIVAWAGLSATWSLMDGQDAETALLVGRLAIAELAT